VIDCYGAFFKFHEVKAFNRIQIALVDKIYHKSFVPQNEPPMVNIIGQVQNHSFSNDAILASTPFSNYVKRYQ
jgi:hypothetical protein